MHDFSGGSDGNSLNGVVVKGENLFGATTATLFEYSIGTGLFTTIYNYPSGTYPDPSVAGADRRGNVFGFTGGQVNAGTGTSDTGTLFELKTHDGGASYKYVTLYSFNEATGGANPDELTVTAQGSLIGVTRYGPAFDGGNKPGFGTLFSYADGTLTTLVTFNALHAADGRNPAGAPAVAASGAIFGPTTVGGDTNCYISAQGLGCGVVFEYTP